MRILLDECLPKRLKRDLIGHDARTVPEMGWASCQNGDLLGLAQHEFDVFLTVDRNSHFRSASTLAPSATTPSVMIRMSSRRLSVTTLM